VQLHLLMKLVGSSLATGLERIEIQRQLRDLEERNELALYSANDGLWDFDTINNRVYLSPRWKAMLGYDEAEVGQAPDWRTLVHSDDMSRVQAAIRDHVAGKTPIFESLHRMRHATGEWRWVISRAKAKVDDKGRLLRLVGVELDITERKLYEEALFREKESAQITLQSIGDGVITTDAKGVIDYLNPVAESLTGLAPRGQPGPRHRRDLPRVSRGNLRAAGESPGSRHSPHPLHQIGAADAADPARRQRDLCRKHGIADSRRQRRGVGRRAGVP
jgi:PAS domain S-box-containing protein